MDNLNDIFNLSVDDFKEEEKVVVKNIFKPDSKNGKDGVYKAVVRFLPWHKDAKKSVMKKWSCWMQNPSNNEGRLVDCPSTIGKKSILQDLFWKYKKSESVADQKIAENFSRRQRFASLVQIMKDDNNPDTVGQIMVWPYGIKIHNKINAELKPEFGAPHIPFDLFEAKPFLVHVTQVAGFNNFDNSKFLDEKGPIKIGGVAMTKDAASLTKIKEYLEAGPDLSSYDYQEWDKNMEDWVDATIKAIIPESRNIESISSPSANSFKPVKTESLVTDTVSSSNALDDLDDLNIGSFDDELYEGL